MTKKLERPKAALAAIGLAVLAAGCARQTPLQAKYAAGECRRVSLIDENSGLPVRGAEDMAIDPASGRLFISAYDRRAVERAVRRRARSAPEGGIYSISFSRLVESEAASFAVASIVRADKIAGGLRPHGIAFDPARNEIAFVDRGYRRIDGAWRMTAHIDFARPNGEVIPGAAEPAPCAANNLLFDDDGTLITFDHATCGWRALVEDAFGRKKSGIADGKGRTLLDHVSFANGLARLANGEIALGATRERALLLLDRTAKGLKIARRIALPGGPDNLTLSDKGEIIAAVHPSMLKIALSRRLGIGKAPSRIVQADPESGTVTVLFDDPSGALFSAATVGVERNGALVIGSALDDGVLVCKAAQ